MKDGKKSIFGALLAVIGCVFFAFCYFYGVIFPGTYNGIDGILGGILCAGLIIPFVIAAIVMIAGIVICGIEAFKK